MTSTEANGERRGYPVGSPAPSPPPAYLVVVGTDFLATLTPAMSSVNGALPVFVVAVSVSDSPGHSDTSLSDHDTGPTGAPLASRRVAVTKNAGTGPVPVLVSLTVVVAVSPLVAVDAVADTVAAAIFVTPVRSA